MKYNCPSRVCADRGQANTLIADYMICQPGPNRSSFICGRSVHNQRIEHLWHDLYCKLYMFVLQPLLSHERN